MRLHQCQYFFRFGILLSVLAISAGCRTLQERTQLKAASQAPAQPILDLPTPREMAKKTADKLTEGYSFTRGIWKTTGWWNSANALESVIDYSRMTGNADHTALISATYKRHIGGKFLNEFNDDEAWWALTWIKAYDLTHQAHYLAIAKTIFADIATHWDDHCGGGVWWKKDHKYKNAITNELFLTLASRLHLRTPGDSGPGSFRDWADREWQWFQKSGMISSDRLIVDGLNEQCHPVGQTFTYNQGVILGGLVDYARVSGNRQLLQDAHSIATAAITKLIDASGILRDSNEVAKSDSADQPQFKGIFMRNLAYLYDQRREPAYRDFILNNLRRLWTDNRSSDNQFGYLWAGPFDMSDGARQTSALDLMNAAISVSQPNVALTAKATANVPSCNDHESPAMAVDGSLINDSKWCAHGDPSAILTLDFGRVLTIAAFNVKHAEAGGEANDLNTETFTIESSSDGQYWQPVVTTTDNKDKTTEHPVTGLKARYARLNILRSQTRQSIFATRIFEFEAIGDGK
ncbi:MAG: discoidin domain-containing protein [Proteobacteria bacterium]|nr:discoidin domain-containing protein [Pseudomonadota bacterium]